MGREWKICQADLNLVLVFSMRYIVGIAIFYLS